MEDIRLRVFRIHSSNPRDTFPWNFSLIKQKRLKSGIPEIWLNEIYKSVEESIPNARLKIITFTFKPDKKKTIIQWLRKEQHVL